MIHTRITLHPGAGREAGWGACAAATGAMMQSSLPARSPEAKMFLRNGWYSAIWSANLKGKPVARTFLNEKVVMFRTASGKAAALEDRCCHRAAPLSRGEIRGEHLACGYHGLQFDVTGRCVAVPGQEHVP